MSITAKDFSPIDRELVEIFKFFFVELLMGHPIYNSFCFQNIPFLSSFFNAKSSTIISIAMKNLTQLNQSARFNYGKYTYVPLYDFILSNMLAKYKNLGEAIKAYCFPKLFLGGAIANSLLAGAPPMGSL